MFYFFLHSFLGANLWYFYLILGLNILVSIHQSHSSLSVCLSHCPDGNTEAPCTVAAHATVVDGQSHYMWSQLAVFQAGGVDFFPFLGKRTTIEVVPGICVCILQLDCCQATNTATSSSRSAFPSFLNPTPLPAPLSISFQIFLRKEKFVFVKDKPIYFMYHSLQSLNLVSFISIPYYTTIHVRLHFSLFFLQRNVKFLTKER